MGQKNLQDVYVLFYSGDDTHHSSGIGIMMPLEVQRSVLKPTSVNDRIMLAQFVTEHSKLSVIVCNAPTNKEDEDVKDSFYETLHAATKDIPKPDVVFVLGDLNLKVESGRQCCPEVVRQHGLGLVNEMAHYQWIISK